jgi:hypothetical protein
VNTSKTSLQKIPVYEVRLVQSRRPLRLAETILTDSRRSARAPHGLIALTDREHFAAIFVNGHHHVTGAHIVAIGAQRCDRQRGRADDLPRGPGRLRERDCPRTLCTAAHNVRSVPAAVMCRALRMMRATSNDRGRLRHIIGTREVPVPPCQTPGWRVPSGRSGLRHSSGRSLSLMR